MAADLLNSCMFGFIGVEVNLRRFLKVWFRFLLVVLKIDLLLLAHLSRRLIGELIVYEGIRRPSVRRPSVRLSTFSNDISSEAVRPILLIFHI